MQKDGTRIRGVEVTAMTKESVAYKKGASEDKVPASKVAAVKWDGAPDLFGEAQAKESQGAYGEAANLYIEAATKTERQPLVLEARFFGARAALAGAGGDQAKATAAGTALQSYLNDAPDGFYVPNARLLIGRSLRLQGKAEEATTALKALEDAVLTEGWGLAWDARAKFERARALLALGQAGSARTAYQSVVSAVDAARGGGDDDPELLELKTLSLVGEGETYIADNKPDDALSFFPPLLVGGGRGIADGAVGGAGRHRPGAVSEGRGLGRDRRAARCTGRAGRSLRRARHRRHDREGPLLLRQDPVGPGP